MAESRSGRIGIYIGVAGLVIAALALIRDAFDVSFPFGGPQISVSGPVAADFIDNPDQWPYSEPGLYIGANARNTGTETLYDCRLYAQRLADDLTPIKDAILHSEPFSLAPSDSRMNVALDPANGVSFNPGGYGPHLEGPLLIEVFFGCGIDLDSESRYFRVTFPARGNDPTAISEDRLDDGRPLDTEARQSGGFSYPRETQN